MFDQVHTDLISIVGWRCHCCRAASIKRIKALEDICVSLKDELNKLKVSNSGVYKELEELKSRQSAVDSVPSDTYSGNNRHETDTTSSKLETSSWADVVSGKKSASSQKPSTFHDVMKAVHSDLISKKRRETNVVISGLKQAKNIPDAKLFEDLLLKNLKIKESPISCRRIGTQMEGKIQPLLVVLSTAESANKIISDAKMLRNSECLYTKQHVYINRFLTKSEAEAEFDRRQQRRAREREKKEHGGKPGIVDNTHVNLDNQIGSINESVVNVGEAPSIKLVEPDCQNN